MAFDDPYWPRASDWLAGLHLPKTLGSVTILGAPLTLGSITPGSCELAPDAIRSVFPKFSTYDLEFDNDLEQLAANDLGNLPIADKRPEEALQPISEAASKALSKNADALILLGGDNSITRPGCHGISPSLERCGLLTLDAHLDLRDLESGFTNGNPVRALLADGLPGRQIVQIGIQSFSNSQVYAHVAREANITVITREQVRARGIAKTVRGALDELARQVDVIYVDLDLDVLDRAYAPAAPGSRPGGLTALELRIAARICGLHPKVRAIDLVEVDPSIDAAEATSLAAAACLLSFASGVLLRRKGRTAYE